MQQHVNKMFPVLLLINKMCWYYHRSVNTLKETWVMDVDPMKDLQGLQLQEITGGRWDAQLMMITCFHYLMVLNQQQSTVNCRAPRGSRFFLQLGTTPGDLTDEFRLSCWRWANQPGLLSSCFAGMETCLFICQSRVKVILSSRL